jgi:hypothetical protein
MDQHHPGHDQYAAQELHAGRELAQEQPGHQHSEQHLGQSDEGGQF